MNCKRVEDRLRPWLRIAFCALLFFCICFSLRAGEIIDRIVATVNGHIILQSDWDEDVRYEALLNGRALDQITAEDRKSALDRLIDQELLRQQAKISDSWQPSTDQVSKALQQIRQQLPDGGTDRLLQAALTSYGLSDANLRCRVVFQLELMHFADTRLRPAIHVDSKNIESYYNQELLPQLRRSGSKPVPLATVSTRIQELLTQQQVNDRLVSWIQQLRAASNIHTDFRGHGE
jgi:peptidyl-prolyl cis-trans isomerase SurA